MKLHTLSELHSEIEMACAVIPMGTLKYATMNVVRSTQKYLETSGLQLQPIIAPTTCVCIFCQVS